MILHTEITGNGEPMIILHTGLQTGQVDFEAQREHFKQNYRVITPDLRGHGNSVATDFSNYLQDSVHDLKETLDGSGVERAHIIGCSLGALIGLIFAKKFPEMVHSLTISGIIPEKPANWKEINAQDAEQQSRILKNEEAVAYFDSLHKSNWKELLNVTNGDDWYPFIETSNVSMLDMPVLFLVGEGSSLETKGAVLYPQENKNIHVAIIPFAAHNVHLEQPEIYIKVVEKFLSEVAEVSYDGIKNHAPNHSKSNS